MDKWMYALQEFYDGRTTDMLPAAIFGSGTKLSDSLKRQQRVRIGMIPCLSDEAPYVAMGLMTLLSSLLERWSEVRVYRLFFKTHVSPQAYAWSISDSQFGLDNWAFDALDENAVLSATLTQDMGMWRLSVLLENDLAEEGQPDFQKTYDAPNLSGLVNRLAEIADDLIAQFDVSEIRPIPVPTTSADDTKLSHLLEAIFRWQMQLLLVLYGKGWAEGDIRQQFDSLVGMGVGLGDDFGAWATSQAVAHGLRDGYAPVPDSLVTMLDGYVEKFAPYTLYPSIVVGRALFHAGHANVAYDIFESETERNPHNPSIWLAKADIYWRAGRISQLVATYQEAIARGMANASLYQQYASVLEMLQEDKLPTYALIDPDDYDADYLAWEAIEAYDEALQRDPDNLTCLQNQTLLLLDVYPADEARLYDVFGRLLKADKTGEHIRAVVELCDVLEDIDPIFDPLQAMAEAHPTRPDLRISLAILAMHLDDPDTAAAYLDEAEALTDDESILADIDRLMLAVDDPEFEEHMGTIYAQVSGGNRISANDIHFLEDALEKAPLLADGYLYLAQAYRIWGKPDLALKTIKEGYAQLPAHPEIAELLARYEWEWGDKQEAQQYLTAGLSVNPMFVPLIARMGQFLFQLGQKEAAKAWLARAEQIAPKDPILVEVRKFIADAMVRGG